MEEKVWNSQACLVRAPRSEVNWAQLAQTWASMRSKTGLGVDDTSVPPPPPSNSNTQDNLPDPLLPPSAVGFSSALSDGSDFNLSSASWMPLPPPPGGFLSAGGPFPPIPPFLPPPWIPVPPIGAPPHPNSSFPHMKGEEDEEGGEYSHYYKEWEEQQERGRHDDTDDKEGIPQGAMAHWLNQTWSPSSPWYRSSEQSPYVVPFIDQQTRKALPAWIREGLEKAELERQKKFIKDERLRVAEEAAKLKKASKGQGKFDSDSSEGEGEKKVSSSNGKIPSTSQTKNERAKKEQNDAETEVQSIVDLRTDEEKKEDAMMLLRRFLTEILLETTDELLSGIVSKVIESERLKSAQPSVLVKSSALAALSSLGAESDEESGEGLKNACNSGLEQDRLSPIEESSHKVSIISKEAFVTKSKAKLSSHEDGSSPEIVKGNDSGCGEKYMNSHAEQRPLRRNRDRSVVNSSHLEHDRKEKGKHEVRSGSDEEGFADRTSKIKSLRQSDGESSGEYHARSGSSDSSRSRSAFSECRSRSKDREFSRKRRRIRHNHCVRNRRRSRSSRRRSRSRESTTLSHSSRSRSPSITPDRYVSNHKSRLKERTKQSLSPRRKKSRSRDQGNSSRVTRRSRTPSQRLRKSRRSSS